MTRRGEGLFSALLRTVAVCCSATHESVVAIDDLAVAKCSQQRSRKQELLTNHTCVKSVKSPGAQGKVARFDAGRFWKMTSLRGVGKLPDLVRKIVKLATLFNGRLRFRGLSYCLSVTQNAALKRVGQ